MSFRQFYELVEDEKSLGHSWLSPQGKLIPLSNMSHGGYAKSKGSTIEDMWKAGYFRINFYGNKLYAHNEINPNLNHRQKSELINFAVQAGFTHVVIDSGDNEKIIWSEYDPL
jgi:hypothetical protein